MIEWTINAGSLFTGLISFFGFAIGGIVVAVSMRNNIDNLKTEVTSLQVEIRKLNDVLTKLAVQDTRIDRLEQDVRELKHGEGYVLPLRKGALERP